MGGRGAGPYDRDVGQRRQIVHGEALVVDVRRESAISNAGAHGHGSSFRIEHHLVEMLERDLLLRAVGDAVE